MFLVRRRAFANVKRDESHHSSVKMQTTSTVGWVADECAASKRAVDVDGKRVVDKRAA